MTFMLLLHALLTIIFVLATVAQAESIPHRGRLTQSGQVAMEVEAVGMDGMEVEADDMDDQYAEAEPQRATSRIIRSRDSVRKQPVAVKLGVPVFITETTGSCIKKKGTCHSMCAKTVEGHAYKREWCYTTPKRKPTKKWCFCTPASGDDETPEQIVASPTRGSAIPVEKVASGELTPEPSQVSSGQDEDLVGQVKAMSAKLEGLQSVVHERLEKVDHRLKEVGTAVAAGRKEKNKTKAAKDEDLDDMDSTDTTNSTNSSNETDIDRKVRKASGAGVLLLLILCVCMPICGVLMATDKKAPNAAVPPEQQESVTNPGDEQALTEQAANPAAATTNAADPAAAPSNAADPAAAPSSAAPSGEETSATQGQQSVVAS